MARLYLLAFLLLLALTAVAMISCLSAEAGEVRTFPRGLWVVVILLLPLFGPVLYFAFGRPQRPDGHGLASGLPPAPKNPPLAPDDDPDFLRRLGRGHPATGPRPPKPSGDTRGTDSAAPHDSKDDSRSPDDTDEGRTRGDARTTDDQPPTDGNH